MVSRTLVNYDLLDLPLSLQRKHEATTPAATRKKIGQFFTPATIARFMAARFLSIPKSFKVLDAGAGVGMLSAAVCERLLRLRSPREIHIDLFENDLSLRPLLRKTMNHCKRSLITHGHTLKYRILEEDFVKANSAATGQMSFSDIGRELPQYDAAIMNPPYFKINGNGFHAELSRSLIHSQPNIYALFMALAAALLEPGGRLVAITPRSFCNGLYFRPFRHWFFKRMSLETIHLFESRSNTFRDSNVLQENVITSCVRQSQPISRVTISTSVSDNFSDSMQKQDFPASFVLDSSSREMFVRIPENPMDAKIMRLVESWPNIYEDLGLQISTGPVVTFRATEFLLDSVQSCDAAPLITVHNVLPFQTLWPVQKRSKPIAFKVCDTSLRRKLLVSSRNYVLLRRFSAKEERRRLTASCLLHTDFPMRYIALENHLNYVYHRYRELTVPEVYGISAIFNSMLLDRYFRTISGNTQVNATEIRGLPFPDLKTIACIGKRVSRLKDLTPSHVENVVLDVLNLNGTLKSYLTESLS